jgi:hypothetical protein
VKALQTCVHKIQASFVLSRTQIHASKGENMLKVEFVRNGKNHIIGTKISGFGNGGTVARDSGKILGRSSKKFRNTRDSHRLVTSVNQTDSLFDWWFFDPHR